MKFNLETVRHLLREDGWEEDIIRTIEGFYLKNQVEAMLAEIVGKGSQEAKSTRRLEEWICAGLKVRRIAGHAKVGPGIDGTLVIKVAFYAADPKTGKVTMYGYMTDAPAGLEVEN